MDTELNQDLMEVENTSSNYVLSAQCYGHQSQVRKLVVVNEDMFISSGRDNSVRFWRRLGDTAWENVNTFVAHETERLTMGISAIAFIGKVDDQILFATGGYDNLIHIWDLNSGSIVHTLTGHGNGITSLRYFSNGDLVSTSADTTAIVWRNFERAETLSGHEQVVWDSYLTPNGNIVTCSGDKTIRIWDGSTCIKVIKAHEEAVRGLSHLEGYGFLSCSNDSTIKLWTYDGTFIRVIIGHPEIVYCVAGFENGRLASGGEDKSVKIYEDWQVVSSMDHPKAIWDVEFLPNGDLLTACQDGCIRIFTNDMSRIADQQEIDAFEKEVLEREVQAEGSVGDLNLSQLPGPEALLVQGRTDGDVQMIREDGGVNYYVWHQDSMQWKLEGKVVDAIDKEAQEMQEKYKYVFDVELGDSTLKRKIGFNPGDNPYETARRFIEEQEISPHYLDTIARHIINNVPEEALSPVSVDGNNGNQTKGPKSDYGYFPHTSVITFEGMTIATALEKILSVNETLNVEKPEYVLDEKEISTLRSLVDTITKTSFYHSTTIKNEEFDIIFKMLYGFPKRYLLPVLDLIRMASLHPTGARKFANELENISNYVLDGDIGSPANIIIFYRFISNMFMLQSIRSSLFTAQDRILEGITENFEGTSNAGKLAMATVLLNFSVAYYENFNKDGAMQAISTLSEILNTESTQEVQFRLLVTLANLLLTNTEIKDLARDLELFETIQTMTASEEKVQKIIQEIGTKFK